MLFSSLSPPPLPLSYCLAADKTTVMCSTDQHMTQCLTHWVKFSADILKYLFIFSTKTGFDISCKWSPKETICMKCQILFSGKKKKKIYIYIYQFVICCNSPESGKRVKAMGHNLVVQLCTCQAEQEHKSRKYTNILE